MGDIGLEGAYGGIGMSDALNQAQNLRLKLWQMGEQQRLANAELGQKQQGLDEVHADRLARIQDQQATAAQAATDREDAQKLRSLNLATTMIPPNTTLPQGEGQRLLNLGLTPDRLKTNPAQPASLPGVTQTAGLIPLNRTDASAQTTTTPAPTPPVPETQTYLGTNTQLEKQAADTRANTAQSDKVGAQQAMLDQHMQQFSQQMDLAAQKLEAQGKVNEANIMRAEAQAALDRAKATQTAQPKPDKPLPYQAAQNIASLNTAEIEGVKVLKALHDSGLDQSNNPADPRWNQFVVTTLKIAPSDYQKADIQQRAAFVNAALTRQLMGGRPSQYVAQLLQQHLPQGQMSGQQLAHVMSNVLQQAGEQRDELGQLIPGVKGPMAGSYKDFLGGLAGGGTGNKPSAADLIKKYSQ